MKTNFTEKEIAVRRTLVCPIVEAAYSIRGIALGQEKIAELAVHWEVALSNVPTNQLRTLYREGVGRRCQTAEQFAIIWDMKMEALAREMEFKAARKKAAEPKPEYPVPDFILESWGVAEAKAA